MNLPFIMLTFQVEVPKVQKKKLVKKTGDDINKAMANVSIGKKKLLRKKTSQDSESKQPLAKRSLRIRKQEASKVPIKKVLKKKKVAASKPEEKEDTASEDKINEKDEVVSTPSSTNLLDIKVKVEDVMKVTSDSPNKEKKVSKEIKSITRAIRNVLRRDSSEKKQDILKRKAKEIVSKARKAHLVQKKSSPIPPASPSKSPALSASISPHKSPLTSSANSPSKSLMAAASAIVSSPPATTPVIAVARRSIPIATPIAIKSRPVYEPPSDPIKNEPIKPTVSTTKVPENQKKPIESSHLSKEPDLIQSSASSSLPPSTSLKSPDNYLIKESHQVNQTSTASTSEQNIVNQSRNLSQEFSINFSDLNTSVSNTLDTFNLESSDKSSMDQFFNQPVLGESDPTSLCPVTNPSVIVPISAAVLELTPLPIISAAISSPAASSTTTSVTTSLIPSISQAAPSTTASTNSSLISSISPAVSSTTVSSLVSSVSQVQVTPSSSLVTSLTASKTHASSPGSSSITTTVSTSIAASSSSTLMLSTSSSSSCLSSVSLYDTIVSTNASSNTESVKASDTSTSTSEASTIVTEIEKSKARDSDGEIVASEPSTENVVSKASDVSGHVAAVTEKSVTNDTSKPAKDDADDSLFDIKLPDKNQLFDSLFEKVDDKKLTPVISTKMEEKHERLIKSISSSKPPPLTRAPPNFNPTTVTNSRLGKDPPITSLNFGPPKISVPPPPPVKDKVNIDLSFDDMSDLSDSEEGLAAPLFENILSVLSPPEANVPLNQDLDNPNSLCVPEQATDNKENKSNSLSSIFDLPDDVPLSQLKPTKLKTKEDLVKTPEKNGPPIIAPIKIPKSVIKDSILKDFASSNLNATPPIKFKILRTNDGSWTTSEKKKKRRKERVKKAKPFLISFLKSPEIGRKSPSLVIKRANFEKENEALPSLKLKIKKPKPKLKPLSIQRLKIKPLPERLCMSEEPSRTRSRVFSHSSASSESESEDDDPDDGDYTPVKKPDVIQKKKIFVEALKISTDTEDTIAIEDRIPPKNATISDADDIVIEPERASESCSPSKTKEAFVEIVQRRLSEDSDDDQGDLQELETITKIPININPQTEEDDNNPDDELDVDLNPPSPEVLEVEAPPKPIPEVIDLDDDNAVDIPIPKPDEKEVEVATKACNNVETSQELMSQEPAAVVISAEKAVAAPSESVAPPSEIDLAIHSIMGDNSSSQFDSRDKLDFRGADKPLACSDMEIDSAISSILGGDTFQDDFIQPSINQQPPIVPSMSYSIRETSPVPPPSTASSIQTMEEGRSQDGEIDNNSTLETINESIVVASGESSKTFSYENNANKDGSPVILEAALHEEKISDTEVLQKEESDIEAQRKDTTSDNSKTIFQPELILKADEPAAAVASIFDIAGAKDDQEKNTDVERVKTSHLELSDESSDDDIDEILNKDDHDTSFESNVEDPEEHHEDEAPTNQDTIMESHSKPREAEQQPKSKIDLSDESSDEEDETEETVEEAPESILQSSDNIGLEDGIRLEIQRNHEIDEPSGKREDLRTEFDKPQEKTMNNESKDDENEPSDDESLSQFQEETVPTLREPVQLSNSEHKDVTSAVIIPDGDKQTTSLDGKVHHETKAAQISKTDRFS